MKNSLSVEIHSRLVPVRENEWRRLFPDSTDPLELMKLAKRPDFTGFVFHSLVVRHEDCPILVLPLFETECRLTEVLGASAGKLARIAERWFFNRFRIRTLGVGFVDSEWGEVGVDAAVARELLGQAWEMALESLDALADGLGARLLAWVNFTSRTGRMIPMNRMQGYAAVSGVPIGILPLCRRVSCTEHVTAQPSAESSARVTLFKHRKPLFQWALRILRRRDADALNAERLRAELGKDWL